MASPQASPSDKANNNGASRAGDMEALEKGTRKQSGKQSLQQNAELSVRSALGVRSSEVKGKSSLGYTRMTLACGACRGRKMRCVLASDDPQGRCVTCIRLKKVCAFYPPERKQSRTHRAQTSDKARPTVDNTSGEGSSSLAGQSQGCASVGGEQLDGSAVPASAASFASTDSLYGPWSLPPNSLECNVSGFGNRSTSPSWPQSSLLDGLVPWQQPDNLSYGHDVRRVDDIPDYRSMFNLVASTEGLTSIQMDVAAEPSYRCDTSASFSSWTMPFDQTYPPASQVSLPNPPVTAGQWGLAEPLQSRIAYCEILRRDESFAQDPFMADIHATDDQANRFGQKASALSLRLDGDLYRRRGRSLIAFALKACGRQVI